MRNHGTPRGGAWPVKQHCATLAQATPILQCAVALEPTRPHGPHNEAFDSPAPPLALPIRALDHASTMNAALWVAAIFVPGPFFVFWLSEDRWQLILRPWRFARREHHGPDGWIMVLFYQAMYASGLVSLLIGVVSLGVSR